MRTRAGGNGGQWWRDMAKDPEAFDSWFASESAVLERMYGFKQNPDWYRPNKDPRLWEDADFNQPNQPVVGVSWYEAMAYCAWLTSRLKQAAPAWWPADGRTLKKWLVRVAVPGDC